MLYTATELSNEKSRLAFGEGSRQRRAVSAVGDLAGLFERIARRGEVGSAVGHIRGELSARGYDCTFVAPALDSTEILPPLRR